MNTGDILEIGAPEKLDEYEMLFRRVGLFDCANGMQEVARLRRSGFAFRYMVAPFRGLFELSSDSK